MSELKEACEIPIKPKHWHKKLCWKLIRLSEPSDVFSLNVLKEKKKIHFQYGLYGFQSLPWIFLSEYLKINNADNKHLFVNINLIKFSLSDEQEY